MQTETIKGPPAFASAAINGDWSGLTDQDVAECFEWMRRNVPPGWTIEDVAEEAHFSWQCRAWGLPYQGGELVEYTIMGPVPVESDR